MCVDRGADLHGSVHMTCTLCVGSHLYSVVIQNEVGPDSVEF